MHPSRRPDVEAAVRPAAGRGDRLPAPESAGRQRRGRPRDRPPDRSASGAGTRADARGRRGAGDDRRLVGARKRGRSSMRERGPPGRECWRDIWSVIGPMLEGALWRGEATFSDDLLLPLDRHGYREECYFTLSFSPIRDEAGGVHGVFTTAAETTQRVLGERRLRTLRDLALHGMEARTTGQACESAVRTLAANPGDIPFALLYLLEADGKR